jgi:hypothetical protein
MAYQEATLRGMASATVVVTLATAVYAHHSYPDFLLDQTATVDGTIESIQFENRWRSCRAAAPVVC